MVYDSANDAYKLCAMCSSDGTNRVVDIARNSSGNIVAGANARLWTQGTNAAQYFQFVHYGDGKYYIALKSNPNLVLTIYDNNNGSSGGTSSTSSGNVFVAAKRSYANGNTATEISQQLWRLKSVTAGRSINDGVYTIQSFASSLHMTYFPNNSNNVAQYSLVPSSIDLGMRQRFYVRYVSDGYYQITTLYSNHYRLSVDSTNNIVMSPASSGAEQLFRIIPCGSDTFRIVGKYDTENYKCVDLQNGASAAGTNILYYYYHGATCQRWRFQLETGFNLYEDMGWSYMFGNASLYSCISNDFRPNDVNNPHYGIDIISRSGSINNVDIFTTTTGVVKKVSSINQYGEGNFILIETNTVDPTTGKKIRFSCMHMASPSILSEGTTVSLGNILGKVGSTGNSTGPHLHFSVLTNGGIWDFNSDTNPVDGTLFFPNIDFLYL